jgi:hypothetical protein
MSLGSDHVELAAEYGARLILCHVVYHVQPATCTALTVLQVGESRALVDYGTTCSTPNYPAYSNMWILADTKRIKICGDWYCRTTSATSPLVPSAKQRPPL